MLAMFGVGCCCGLGLYNLVSAYDLHRRERHGAALVLGFISAACFGLGVMQLA
jgi:hypothetical protein